MRWNLSLCGIPVNKQCWWVTLCEKLLGSHRSLFWQEACRQTVCLFLYVLIICVALKFPCISDLKQQISGLKAQVVLPRIYCFIFQHFLWFCFLLFINVPFVVMAAWYFPQSWKLPLFWWWSVSWWWCFKNGATQHSAALSPFILPWFLNEV